MGGPVHRLVFARGGAKGTLRAIRTFQSQMRANEPRFTNAPLHPPIPTRADTPTHEGKACDASWWRVSVPACTVQRSAVLALHTQPRIPVRVGGAPASGMAVRVAARVDETRRAHTYKVRGGFLLKTYCSRAVR